MRVLLLGVGMQGKLALHDLTQSDRVTDIVAADRDIDALLAFVRRMGYGSRVQCEAVDASDMGAVERLFERSVDIVVDLLPPEFIDRIAECAVHRGVHYVNTFFVTPGLQQMSRAARDRSVALLPEFGLDPGIDLVLLGEAVRQFDTVTEVMSYGAGIPAPEAADNPINYKVSWTFEGVLRGYRRAARVVRDGAAVTIPETDIFASQHTHELDIEGLGRLEAYPNEDFVQCLTTLGLDLSTLRQAGRYSLRWPGHLAFWGKIADLHLLDDDPVLVDGRPIDRKRYLARALEPHLQYGEAEQDLAILRVDVAGTRAGKPGRIIYQVIDRRDLETGFTAMSRLVGFTASIGAQLINSGDISGRGLLSPVRDVPFDRFTSELAKRGVRVETRSKTP
ncbi:MAG: saccharopine dehydrogenase NADP-binding domain-containing protein [Gemmatimonadota bacterium]|nr:saccharopine dehydrogenase NADP-binding domain-containing protein [Gemmatimonadota bacterium]